MRRRPSRPPTPIAWGASASRRFRPAPYVLDVARRRLRDASLRASRSARRSTGWRCASTPPTSAPEHVTFVYAPQALPGRDGTSTATVTRAGIDALPGGTTRALNDVLATQPGFTRDDQGAVHVRGNFAGLQLRVDGVTLPPSAQNHLQQLLDAQIVDRADVILGGLPAEFGENVAGVVDIQTRRPGPKPYAEAQVLYGTYGTLRWQEAGDFRSGPFSIMAAGSVGTTARGLDPPAASPILHDRLHDGHAFLRVEERLGGADRLQLLGAYGRDPLSDPDRSDAVAAVGGAAGRGARRPTSTATSRPTSSPSTPTRPSPSWTCSAALTWFHDFGPRATLQVSPFVRDETSTLTCDTARQLGADRRSGADLQRRHPPRACTRAARQPDDRRRPARAQDRASGSTFSATPSDYTAYVRDDASPAGGPDPARDRWRAPTRSSISLGAVYVQDRIALGK